MKLYLVRHGDAVERTDWKGDESARPLTPVGEEEMKRMADALASHLSPETIITSPYERAARTAVLIAQRCGRGGEPRTDPRLAPGFDLKGLRQILAENAGAGSLLLVGHEPDFSRLIARLTGGGSVSLKKGAIARIDWDEGRGSGTLEWLLPPNVLVRAARPG